MKKAHFTPRTKSEILPQVQIIHNDRVAITGRKIFGGNHFLPFYHIRKQANFDRRNNKFDIAYEL